MTPDGQRPPILVVRGEGSFGTHLELLLLHPDGTTLPIGRHDQLGPEAGLATLVQGVAATGTPFQDVVVDLEQVTWLNSTGLGWLVELFREREKHGDTVVLAGASDRVTSILEVTSLNLVLPNHESLAAAARSLRPE